MPCAMASFSHMYAPCLVVPYSLWPLKWKIFDFRLAQTTVSVGQRALARASAANSFAPVGAVAAVGAGLLAGAATAVAAGLAAGAVAVGAPAGGSGIGWPARHLSMYAFSVTLRDWYPALFACPSSWHCFADFSWAS